MKNNIQRTTLAKLSAFVASALLCLGQSAQAANTADNVNNGQSDLTAAATYSGGLPTTTNDVTFTAVAYSPSTFTLNTPGFNLSTGTLDDLSSTALTIQNTAAGSYSTITLNGGVNNTAGSNVGDLLYVGSSSNLTIGGGSNGTLFLTAATAGNLDIAGSATIAGPFTGSVALSKTGAGTLDLSSGVPTVLTSGTIPLYTGTLTLSAGVVELSNTAALQGGTVLNNSAGAVGLVFDSAVASHTFNIGGLSSSSGSSTLALTDTGSTAINLVVGSSTSSTYAGVLSGAGSTLTNVGSGTLTLSGTSTYSGSTTVGGKLALTGALTNSTVLNMDGGTFSYSKAGGTSTQSFTTTNINQGASFIKNTVSGDTLALGTINNGAGGTVDFTLTGPAVTTSSSNTSGTGTAAILGGWATAGGTSWATVSSGAITSLGAGGYETTAAGGTAAANYAGTNIDVSATSTTTIVGNITANSIRFNAIGASTLTLATGVNVISSGGILLGSGVNSTNTLAGGTIEAGAGNTIYINGPSAANGITINSVIANNGSATAVVYSDPNSTSALGGTNTYTGGTYVNEGELTGSSGNTSAFGTGTIYLGATNDSAAATIAPYGATITNAITVNPGGTRTILTANGNNIGVGPVSLLGGATVSLTSGGGGIAVGASSGTSISGTGNVVIASSAASRAGVYTFAGTVNNSGYILNTNQGFGTATFANGIGSNVTDLTQDSVASGTLITGTAAYTGPTIITLGTLQLGGTLTGVQATAPTIGAAGATGTLSASSDIVDNGLFSIDRTGTVIQGTNFSTNGITGTGALTLSGAGTTVLTAANTYTGATTINTTSTLQLGNGTNNVGSLSTSSAITDTGTFAIDRTGVTTQGTDFAAAASFTGAGGLSQIGTGTTVLSGTNAYAGGTTISAGVLQLGNGTSNGTLATTSAITDNATLIFDENTGVAQGTDFSTAAITGSGNVTVEGAAVTLNAANAFGSLTDLGVVNVATVAVSGAAQPLGEGLISLAGTSATTGVINYTGGTSTLGNNITVGSGQGTINNAGSGVLTLGGAISKNGTTLNLTGTGNNTGSFNVTGLITGANASSDLNVIGTTVKLSNTNTYNGPTSVYGPTTTGNVPDVLQGGIANALPSTSLVTLGSTAEGSNSFENVLDLNGYSQTIAGLSSANNANDINYVVNGNTDYAASGFTNPAPSVLTIAPAAASTYTFAGVVGGAATSNNFGVTMAGSGAEVFTGANTYTGGTTVSSGTLYVNNTAGSGTGTGNVSVTGGTLAGSGTISGAVTVQSSATLYSGAAQATTYATPTTGKVNGTGTGGGMTLSSTLAVNAGSSLTFALGNGSSSGSTFDTPNTNSTFLTTGGTAGTVMFGTGAAININLVDLAASNTTNDTLQLRNQSPYLLIEAGTNTLTSNLAYNLVTTGGYDGNGLVLGIYTGGSTTQGALGDTYEANSFAITVLDPTNNSNLTTSQNYYGLQLYLDNGQLEVVPEPGTWALMLGGLALLIVIQRRKNKQSSL